MVCEQCDDEICQNDIQEHTKSLCRKRLVPCPHCGAQASAELLESHIQNSCPSVSIECPEKCGAPAMRRAELEKHFENDCHLRILDCPFRTQGCMQRQQRRHLENHLKESMSKHLELVAIASHHANVQISRLTLRNADLEQRLSELGNSYQQRLREEETKANIKCGCQSGCDTHRCICAAAGKTCSVRCRCSGCLNPDPSTAVLRISKDMEVNLI